MIIVKRLDDGQALDMLHACILKHFTTTLELFLDDEPHANNLGSSLTTQVEHANTGIAVSKEIVDKQHTILGSKILLTDDKRVLVLLGERTDGGGIESTHG